MKQGDIILYGCVIIGAGVEVIDCLNKPFDANFHQAIMQEKKDGVESGIVIEVLQKGYVLKDRILRPAMVYSSNQLLQHLHFLRRQLIDCKSFLRLF